MQNFFPWFSSTQKENFWKVEEVGNTVMYLIYLPVKSVRVVLSGRCPYVNLYLHLLNFPPWFFSKVVQDCQKFLTWNSMVATTTSILGNASKMLAAIAKVGIKIVDKKAAFFKELHFIIFNFWMIPFKRSFWCKVRRYLFMSIFLSIPKTLHQTIEILTASFFIHKQNVFVLYMSIAHPNSVNK